MAIVNSGSLLCVYPKTKCLIAKASTVGSRVDIPSTIMECQAVTAVPSTGAHDYHRQSRTANELTGHVPIEEAEGGATSGLEEAEAAVVLAIIRGLSETYRETLILRLVEGMTGPEIAARTGLTPGSVRVNLHRGMEQLRTKLGRVSTALRKRNEHER